VVDDLIKRFERRPPKITTYVDDIGIIITGICPSTLSSIMEPTLREVCEWKRQALVCITGALRSTPLKALETIYRYPRLTNCRKGSTT